MIRPIFHLMLHVIVPLFTAKKFYPGQWRSAWFIMLATMAVDLDHLVAEPIYAPNRCSIGFHPLHSYWAVTVYGLLLGFKKTRLVALGLVIHMLLDGADCFLMSLR